MKKPVQNILVIQTAFIGDIIMSTPLIEGLRVVYPDAAIDVIVNSKYTSLLLNNPHIRTVIGFEKSKRKALNLLRLIYNIRKNRYDLAVSMQRHFSASLMMYWGGIKKRVGSSRQALLTHPVKFASGMHIRERAGRLLQKIRPGSYDLQTRLYPSATDYAKSIQFLGEDRHFRLGVAPGSVWETKKWPLEYYMKTIKSLVSEVKIYLIGGGPADISLCDEIIRQCGEKNIINTAGKLSLLQSAALIRQLDLILCNDSAPLHMANAMETPVFAIFGPTVKRFGCYPYQPKDQLIEIELYCRPCSKHGGRVCPEKHFRCMREITPNRVVAMIKQFLKDHQHGSLRITD